MNKKDPTYCSIIDANCEGFKRKSCKDCIIYKNAIKEAYSKTMKMLKEKYLTQQHL
jgi:hypothetical protein